MVEGGQHELPAQNRRDATTESETPILGYSGGNMDPAIGAASR